MKHAKCIIFIIFIIIIINPSTLTLPYHHRRFCFVFLIIRTVSTLLTKNSKHHLRKVNNILKPKHHHHPKFSKKSGGQSISSSIQKPPLKTFGVLTISSLPAFTKHGRGQDLPSNASLAQSLGAKHKRRPEVPPGEVSWPPGPESLTNAAKKSLGNFCQRP